MLNYTELLAKIQASLNEGKLNDGCFINRLNSAHRNRIDWYIYSRVTPDTYALFKSGKNRAVTTLDALAIGPRNYLLIANQVDNFQHRILLPLIFPSVALFLSDADSNVTLLIDTGNAKEMLEVQISVTANMCKILLSKHEPDPKIEVVMRDVIQAVGSLLLPQMLKLADGAVEPQLVSVTLILPPEILAANGGLFGIGLEGIKRNANSFV